MKKQYLTRKQLIELYNAYECSDWRNRISKYLKDSSLEEDTFKVKISNEDISYAKENGDSSQLRSLENSGLILKSKTEDLMTSDLTIDDVWNKLEIIKNNVIPFKGSNLTKSQLSSNAKVELEHIYTLLNDGIVLDFDDKNQYKYYPYFYKEKGKWLFSSVSCTFYISYGVGGFGCYAKNSKIAEYVGKQFIKIYENFLS